MKRKENASKLVICMGVKMEEIRKKIVTIIGIVMLSIIISVLSENTLEVSALENENYRYTIDETNKTVTIEAYTGEEKEVTVPARIDGYPVTILDGAFYRDTDVQKVILPNTIKEITGWTFYYCTNLKEVILNEGITIIDQEVFSGCSKLEKINLPGSLREIGNSAFSACGSLKEIKIPSGIKKIPDSLFYGCASLVSVSLPTGIESIGTEAFMMCGSLRNLILPESIKKIYSGAFNSCYALTELCLPDNLELLESTGLLPRNIKYYVKADTNIYQSLSIYGFNVIAKIDFTKAIGFVVNYTYTSSYTGKEVKPELLVKIENQRLTKETDYKVSYNNNVNIGVGNITISGIGKYTGSVTYHFSIIPQKVINVKQIGYSESGIKVQWNPVSGNVDGYQLYRYDSVSKTYKKIKSILVNSATETRLSPSMQYIYKVRAYKKIDNKIFYGEFSNAATAVTSPSKVSNFRWMESKSDRVRLRWDRGTSKVSGYQIYKYSNTQKKYILLKTISQSAQISWTNMYLKSNTEYRYKIRAYITVNGNTFYGPLSDEVMASTATTAPKYTLSSDNKGQIKVTWDKVAGATGYVLFYKTSADGEWRSLTNSQYTGTSYTKKNLESGKKYYFYVKAVKYYDGVKVKSAAYFKNKTAS